MPAVVNDLTEKRSRYPDLLFSLQRIPKSLFCTMNRYLGEKNCRGDAVRQLQARPKNIKCRYI